jgi:hypothetical protein
MWLTTKRSKLQIDGHLNLTVSRVMPSFFILQNWEGENNYTRVSQLSTEINVENWPRPNLVINKKFKELFQEKLSRMNFLYTFFKDCYAANPSVYLHWNGKNVMKYQIIGINRAFLKLFSVFVANIYLQHSAFCSSVVILRSSTIPVNTVSSGKSLLP